MCVYICRANKWNVYGIIWSIPMHIYINYMCMTWDISFHYFSIVNLTFPHYVSALLIRFFHFRICYQFPYRSFPIFLTSMLHLYSYVLILIGRIPCLFVCFFVCFFVVCCVLCDMKPAFAHFGNCIQGGFHLVTHIHYLLFV